MDVVVTGQSCAKTHLQQSDLMAFLMFLSLHGWTSWDLGAVAGAMPAIAADFNLATEPAVIGLIGALPNFTVLLGCWLVPSFTHVFAGRSVRRLVRCRTGAKWVPLHSVCRNSRRRRLAILVC